MATASSTADYLTGATRSATLTQDSYNQALADVENQTASESKMKEGLAGVDAAAQKARTPKK